uniref:Synaptophysin n=1 Tax=Chrysemys picta bellii TaxID=8478 RepID=A0A8C3H9E9_CHRPI
GYQILAPCGLTRPISPHLAPQLFAIFAFATCGTYSGEFRLSVECVNKSESDLNIEVEFGYPFRAGGGAGGTGCGGPGRGLTLLSPQDFVVTAVFAFMWLVSSCAWAKGLSDVFGFLNLVLWTGNLWFVFKETGWSAPFAKYPPAVPEKQPAPDTYADSYNQGSGYVQQDSYGQQGGYQPEYNQQGYGQPDPYAQQGGYGQAAPTSFSNQM